ncbi:MAG: hypothetical protein RLZZ175_2279 [Bacteroidota bacterium]|jgi:hypothetical protein
MNGTGYTNDLPGDAMQNDLIKNYWKKPPTIINYSNGQDFVQNFINSYVRSLKDLPNSNGTFNNYVSSNPNYNEYLNKDISGSFNPIGGGSDFDVKLKINNNTDASFNLNDRLDIQVDYNNNSVNILNMTNGTTIFSMETNSTSEMLRLQLHIQSLQTESNKLIAYPPVYPYSYFNFH